VPEPNTEKAKKKFIGYISKDKQSKPVYRLKHISKNWMFRAASIAVFIVLSLTFWKLFLSEHEMVLATQQTFKQELLPDGTNVKLSQNSKITYSSNFAKSNKIIKLEGEANFSVGSAGNGKLQVIADETFIEDIGTVFAVTAYPDSNYINVKVREGQVHFYTKTDKGLIINANEAGVYNKKTKTFKALVQKLDSLAAGTMRVDFQAIALSDAVDIISNAYAVDIQLAKKSIGNKRITVNFDGEDVTVVLQIMAETLNLNLEKEANGYLLSEKN
jgi:ferric-dicitrate binding protein FerR (iron transport regulator)